MRALSLLLLISDVAVAAPKSTGGDHDAPLLINVSEVPRDGHPTHNRLTFSCHFDSGPREIDCVVVQQDLQEPTVVPQEKMDKQLAESGDLLKSCKDYDGPSPYGDGSPDGSPMAKVFARASAACKAKDRAAITEVFREMLDIQNKTCRLTSVVTNQRFRKVDDNTWSREPDPTSMCDNIRIIGTLKRDPKNPHWWNYTESVLATPPKDLKSICTATSETARFTWSKAVTEVEVGCRYVAM